MYSSRQCKNLTYLCRTANDRSQESQYRAENGNLRKSRYTFRHDNVFAPNNCLYEKEATGMEIPKMHSSSWCKNRTYLCGTENYPVSCKSVYVGERKFQKIRVYLLPWYHDGPKGMLISKGSYRYAESKNALLQSFQKPHLPVREGNYPGLCKLVYVRVRKFEEIRVYLSPWYRVCTKPMLKSKGSYRYGVSRNAFLQSVQKLHLPVQDCKLHHLI